MTQKKEVKTILSDEIAELIARDDLSGLIELIAVLIGREMLKEFPLDCTVKTANAVDDVL